MATGMGAGLLLDGRLFEGPLGLAGEIGHLRLSDDDPVGFGKRGSAEGYLSGPGIVPVAAAEFLAFQQAGLETRFAGEATITPKGILDLARGGDPAALRVVELCGRQLGRLGALLVDLFNPDVIVLGTIGTAHYRPGNDRYRALRPVRATNARGARRGSPAAIRGTCGDRSIGAPRPGQPDGAGGCAIPSCWPRVPFAGGAQRVCRRPACDWMRTPNRSHLVLPPKPSNALVDEGDLQQAPWMGPSGK